MILISENLPWYVEGLNDTRTLSEDFFSILLEEMVMENHVRTAEGETQAGALQAATALRWTRSGSY